MNAFLDRVRVAGLVALAACCLAFAAAAGDDDGDDGDGAQTDDGGGAQTESTSGTCKNACKNEQDVCTSGGNSFSECLATYNACVASCDDDDD